MNELPEPPKPDTHCWDDDERVDVWSHSTHQLNQYGAECYRKALEDAAKVCEAIRDEYQRRESLLFSENKTDAQEGADDCAAAIRGMK